MNGSASPKAAIGPVRGLTWPILMTRDCALAGSTRSTAGAATAPRPAAMMRRRLMVPGCFIATSLAKFVGWVELLRNPSCAFPHGATVDGFRYAQPILQ